MTGERYAAGEGNGPEEGRAAREPQAPVPDPWAPPAGGQPPSLHTQPTLAGLPLAPGPGLPTSAPSPFAPPPSLVKSPVPPPPVGPEGPGPQAPAPYPMHPMHVAHPMHGAHPTHPGHPHPGYPVPGGAPYPVPGWGGHPLPPQNGLGVASMVLGIVALVLFCAWPLAIVVGILAVVLGGVGRSRANRGLASNPGQALAGIICGAAGTVLAVALLVVLIVSPGTFPDDATEDTPDAPSVRASAAR
ncbi:DUF4190 domain-containing protein [Streptomyces sp. NPDC002454]